MGGEKGQSHGLPPVGDRYADPGHRRHAGSDPGNHLEWNSLRREHFGLLAAAAEDVRIAALEAHHPLAGTGQADQESVDLLLGNRVVAGRLTDRMEIDLGR